MTNHSDSRRINLGATRLNASVKPTPSRAPASKDWLSQLTHDKTDRNFVAIKLPRNAIVLIFIIRVPLPADAPASEPPTRESLPWRFGSFVRFFASTRLVPAFDARLSFLAQRLHRSESFETTMQSVQIFSRQSKQRILASQHLCFVGHTEQSPIHGSLFSLTVIG